MIRHHEHYKISFEIKIPQIFSFHQEVKHKKYNKTYFGHSFL